MYARGREFMPVIYEDSLEEAYLRLEPKKITDFNYKNEVLEPIRKTCWPLWTTLKPGF